MLWTHSKASRLVTAGLTATMTLVSMTGCDTKDGTDGINGTNGGVIHFENPAVDLSATHNPDQETLLTRTHAVSADSARSAEILAFDPVTSKIFVTDGSDKLQVFTIATDGSLAFEQIIDLSAQGHGAQSVTVVPNAIANGQSLVAVALSRTTEKVDMWNSGYGSGMAKVPTSATEYATDAWYLMSDRGANIGVDQGKFKGKIFPDPTFTPRIAKFEKQADGSLKKTETILFKRPDGTPITGLPNDGSTNTGEDAIDLNGTVLGTDSYGLDSEGLVALWDAASNKPHFYVSDEYGPHIVHYNSEGVELGRINPFAGTGEWVGKTLPLVYGKRRANSGMECLTYVPATEGPNSEAWLVGLMQRTMYVSTDSRKFDEDLLGDALSTTHDLRKSPVTRLLMIPADPTSSSSPKEYIYLRDQSSSSNDNQSTSEIRYVSGSAGAKFVVLERDGASQGKKELWETDISAATNVFESLSSEYGKTLSFDLDNDADLDSLSIEMAGCGISDAVLTTAEASTRLSGLGITVATKAMVLDIQSLPYGHDKAEGFVIIGDYADKKFAFSNDDDFGFDSNDEGIPFQKTIDHDKDASTPDITDHPFVVTVTNGTLDGRYGYPENSWEEIVAGNNKYGHHVFGVVALINASNLAGGIYGTYPAGALPDMITTTSDAKHLLVANEGEPNETYTKDPEGSVTIIDISDNASGTWSKATTIRFTDKDFPASFRNLGPHGTSNAQDAEPEYITSNNGKAYVTLQENNALAIIDIEKATVDRIVNLGYKDGTASGNEFDASNKDDAIALRKWPVLMMYQPDSIASLVIDGKTWLFTANEGDARLRPNEETIKDSNGAWIEEGALFSEETRVGKVRLDAQSFINWKSTLQDNAELGRLKMSTAQGDLDNDGDFDRLYVYGARSFSVWDGNTGALTWDSGNAFAQILATRAPDYFNANSDKKDDRSDDKGAEPEAILAAHIDGHNLVFIGLERAGGIMVYNVDTPTNPVFKQFLHTAGDYGPEGLALIKKADSPTGKNMLLVGNEKSDSIVVYTIDVTAKDILTAPTANN